MCNHLSDDIDQDELLASWYPESYGSLEDKRGVHVVNIDPTDEDYNEDDEWK